MLLLAGSNMSKTLQLQPLQYQKAQDFLELWTELGNKKEAQKWLRKLEKAHARALKKGQPISYERLLGR